MRGYDAGVSASEREGNGQDATGPLERPPECGHQTHGGLPGGMA